MKLSIETIELLKTIFIGIPFIIFIVYMIIKDSLKTNDFPSRYRDSKNYKYFKRLNKKLEKERSENNGKCK